MDLTLSSPKSPTLEAALTRFQHAAMRHEPATSGTYREVPEAVNPVLRGALADRGIQQLYSHQAEAFEAIAQGQNVVVVTPTASGKTLCYNLPVLNRLLDRSGRPRDVSLPDQSSGRRPTPRTADRHRRDGVGDPRIHLRWRHAAGRAQGHPPARQRRADQSGHAALRHSAASHPLGQAVRESALYRHRRAALLSRSLRQPPGKPAAAAEARSASSTDRSPSSSAARPPSPIRANWPRR